MSAAALAAAILALAPSLDGARARSIATDAIEAADRPLGGASKLETAAAIVAVAYAESGLRLDVEQGRARGDHGRSWCLMQIQIGRSANSRIVVDGATYTGRELVESRVRCFGVGLSLLAASERSCASLSPGDRWSRYTTGRCQRDRAARRRWRIWRAIVARLQP